MINIPDTLKISLRAIRINKMRSGLTMLGIIIGVGSVIAMLAVGTGASEKIKEQLSSMGTNLLLVLPGSTTSGGLRMGLGSQPTLTKDDADAVLREIPKVQEVAPVLSGAAQVVYGNQNWSTGVYGSTPGIFVVRDLSLIAGRGFTEQDVRSAT
ncbi:MAG TPA: ABC transporter permease, partial [Syntrophales bacterium]|nr:ABC transporter permease [Syntrophales bacterium]